MQLTRETDFAARDHVVNRRLVELMRMSETEWDEFSRGSAIRRAGYSGFRRNVAVALGNWLTTDAAAADAVVPVLVAALNDLDAIVREHAAWALARSPSAAARAALRARAEMETEPVVAAELATAVHGIEPHHDAPARHDAARHR